MKHKLTSNWGLKLGSFVFAFFLWIIVTNMNDPVVTYRIYNVPVRLVNAGMITEQGQTYEVLDDTDVIDTVTISANRSIIDALGEKDVVAIADFQDLTGQNTIPIKLSTNKYNSNLESIRGNIDTVKLNIENLKSKTLALSTVTSGTVSEGYVVGNVTAAQNQVRISGPETIIDQIIKAQVDVSVTDFTQDISTDAEIVFLDAEKNPVTSDSIKANISTVKVNVELLQTKRVNLAFNEMGVAADGYAATGEISSDPDSILVAGKPAILNKLDTIEVDAEALNITGQTGDMMTLVDITKYLPSGVSLADSGFSGNVSVTAYIEKTVDRRISMNVNSIQWTNVPEGYTVELVDPEDSFEVVINGLQREVFAYDSNAIQVIADLTDILEQEDMVGSMYHTNLKFTIDGKDIKISSPVQVWIKLEDA